MVRKSSTLVLCTISVASFLTGLGCGHTEPDDELLGLHEWILVESVRPESDDAEARPNGPLEYGLKRDDYNAIHKIPPVVITVPWKAFDSEVTQLSESVDAQIVGSTDEVTRFLGTELARGRFLSAINVLHRRNVAVIGSDIAESLFSQDDPIGEDIRIGENIFTVVGVLQEPNADFKPVSDAFATSKSVYITINTMRS